MFYSIKKFFYLIIGTFGFRSKLNLIPTNDLFGNKKQWSSVGSDPYFIVEGTVISGWNELFWESVSEENIPLKIYWDNGDGFSEDRSAVIGEISEGENKKKLLIYIADDAKKIRIDPGEKEVSFTFGNLKIRKVSRLSVFISAIKKYSSQRGLSVRQSGDILRKAIKIYRIRGMKALWVIAKQNIGQYSSSVDDYKVWIENNALNDKDVLVIKERIKSLSYKPLISVIVPVYNVDEIWLRKCVDSVIDQYYPNWELCISDDASTKTYIKRVLEEYVELDPRIKVIFRNENGHISKSSNSALEIAEGEYIALLDHDDELALNALYENVLLLNSFPEADIIYSDEDKLSVKGDRFDPFFKPDWSPDLLLSQMYTCHLSLYRKSLVDQVGGFRVGYEGSQDFDLMLRISELTSNIYHIPKILYHWRAIQSSTASSGSSKDYTHMAGLKAVQDAIERRGYDAEVESIDDHSNVYLTRFKPTGNPKVSIIIPSKNNFEIVKNCIDSIFNKTKYSNFEIIIIDNGSNDPAVHELYRYWTDLEKDRFKMFVLDIPFNYSSLNNFGVSKADGDLLLLLNNDVEIITEEWLDEMVGQAIRPQIGAVGACLYYPDNTLQHGGVILGIGGVAGHSHKYFPSEHTGYFRRLKIVSNYTAVTAACLMIKKDIFLAVGGLEEDLQVAFNDVDFCLKVWSAGYRNLWLPHVKLYHYESKSRGHEDTPEKQERFLKEINFMKKKWSHLLENDPAYSPHLTRIKEDFSIGEPVVRNR